MSKSSKPVNDKSISMQNNKLPKLKTVERLLDIPAVESGYHYAEKKYEDFKKANPLFNWACNQAEMACQLASYSAKPITLLLEAPINAIDDTLSNSIGAVEETLGKSVGRPTNAVKEGLRHFPYKVSNRTIDCLDEILKDLEEIIDEEVPGELIESAPAIKDAATSDKLYDTLLQTVTVLNKLEVGLGENEPSVKTRNLVLNLTATIRSVTRFIVLAALRPVEAVERVVETFNTFQNNVKASLEPRNLIKLLRNIISKSVKVVVKYFLRLTFRRVSSYTLNKVHELLTFFMKLVELVDMKTVYFLSVEARNGNTPRKDLILHQIYYRLKHLHFYDNGQKANLPELTEE